MMSLTFIVSQKGLFRYGKYIYNNKPFMFFGLETHVHQLGDTDETDEIDGTDESGGNFTFVVFV